MNFFDVRDVANILKVNEETVRRWIRRGELEAQNFGGKAGYRIKPESLEKFLAGQNPWTSEQEKPNKAAELGKTSYPAFTIGNLSEMGLGGIIDNLLDESRANKKELEVEVFQKKYEINRRKAELASEIERLKRELSAWNDILEAINSLEDEFPPEDSKE